MDPGVLIVSLSSLVAPRRWPLCLMLRNPNAALPAPLRPCRLSLEQDRHPSYLILIDDCSPMSISSLIPAACRQLTGVSGMQLLPWPASGLLHQPQHCPGCNLTWPPGIVHSFGAGPSMQRRTHLWW